MNQVLHATVGGRRYQMEVDAARILQNYIRRWENQYLSEEDGREILSDIENRVAELFDQWLQGKSPAVVTMEMVQKVLVQLGEPEGRAASPRSGGEAFQTGNAPKGLTRDTSRMLLGGVASGVARYANVPPWLIRLAFVGLLLFSRIGILLYIILWIVLPGNQQVSSKDKPAEEDRKISRGERILCCLVFGISLILLFHLVGAMVASIAGNYYFGDTFSFSPKLFFGGTERFSLFLLAVLLVSLLIISGKGLFGKVSRKISRKLLIAGGVIYLLLTVLTGGYFTTIHNIQPGKVVWGSVGSSQSLRFSDDKIKVMLDEKPFGVSRSKKKRKQLFTIEYVPETASPMISVQAKGPGSVRPEETWCKAGNTITIIPPAENMEITWKLQVPETHTVVIDESMLFSPIYQQPDTTVNRNPGNQGVLEHSYQSRRTL